MLSLLTYDLFEASYLGRKATVQDDPFEIIQSPSNIKDDLSSSKIDNHPLDPSYTNIKETGKKNEIIVTKDKLGQETLELNELATINRLRWNPTILDFCRASLKEKKEFTGKTSILISNLSFLIKMSFM